MAQSTVGYELVEDSRPVESCATLQEALMWWKENPEHREVYRVSTGASGLSPRTQMTEQELQDAHDGEILG